MAAEVESLKVRSCNLRSVEAPEGIEQDKPANPGLKSGVNTRQTTPFTYVFKYKIVFNQHLMMVYLLTASLRNF